MATATPPSDLQHELAVLWTLAHMQCATIGQLHALCFPQAGLATVRCRVRLLGARGWIAHTPWFLPRTQGERGHVWTITLAGMAVLSKYVAVPPLVRLDLGCPSTALERDEWRIRLQTRTFLIQCIHAARQTPMCAAMHIETPLHWPTPLLATVPPPEAIVRIQWTPALQQSATWLPWPGPGSPSGSTYRVYLDRASPLEMLLQRSLRDVTVPTDVVVLILDTPERVQQVLAQVHTWSVLPRLRIAHRAALTTGVTAPIWFDGMGSVGSFAPRGFEVLEGWHAAASA